MCRLEQLARRSAAYDAAMVNTVLSDFIASNRGELIRRCRDKVRRRVSSSPDDASMTHGVALFLDQLVEELRGESTTEAIHENAVRHGRELLLQGFTLGQVVHDYGDVCQSVTEMAVETNAFISAEEFRTLNRCLDDAIAGAVTEFAAAQGAVRDGDSYQLHHLANTALVAFEVLQTGNVGVGGGPGPCSCAAFWPCVP